MFRSSSQHRLVDQPRVHTRCARDRSTPQATLQMCSTASVRSRTHLSVRPYAHRFVCLQLIRNRATFDEQAALFVKQRTAIMRSGNASDGASVASDDRHSSGSYASAAFRSLLCMLPFNIGYGHQSTGLSRSDLIDDDELV